MELYASSGWSLKNKVEFRRGAFEPSIRLEWVLPEAGTHAVHLLLKRFRSIHVVSFQFPDKGKETLGPAVETVISSIRSTASRPRGLPLAEGWRVEYTEHFEVTTNADPDLSGAVGSLLEAGRARFSEVFPGTQTPSQRAMVKLFGSPDELARFREERRLSEEENAFLFEDERLLVTGPMPKGKQTRRFGRWQLDLRQVIWRLFDQFILRVAGRPADPWFTDGGGLWFGLGFTPELETDVQGAAEEIALGIEEDLTSRKAASLKMLGSSKNLTDGQRLLAAGWIHFLALGPGQKKKGRLAVYLEAFSKSWSGEKALEAALMGDKPKKLTRALGRYFLYLAMRARRRR
ncbi:MAG: hypothetical protein ACYTFG_01810 [Planctomycetota bacterium]